MEITIKSNGKAQVIVNGKEAAGVSAAISVGILKGSLFGTVTAFQNNVKVDSNVNNYNAEIPNDVNTEPEVLIADCEAAVVAALEADGFIVV